MVLKTPRVLVRVSKNHLVRVVLPQLATEGRSNPCEGKNRPCEGCKSVTDTTHFEKAESEETFDNLKGPLDCNSNNVIYLFKFRKCQFKFSHAGCIVTTIKDLITIKALIVSLERKLIKRIVQDIRKSELKEKLFHDHYCSDAQGFVLQPGVLP